MRRLAGWLRANPDALIQDVAYSTTARRVHHPIRFAAIASTPQEAASKLEAEIDRAGSVKSSPVDFVFVFTGQGAHYPGMGSEMYHTNSVFRKTVDLCVALCAANNFPPFGDIITDNTINVSARNAAQVQLAVVTLEIALAAFWRSIGIVPTIVMGHSLGEYAALHVAGVLSLTDTLYLVGQRARLLMERCEPDSCAMLSVSASAATVRQYITQLGNSSCSIACINSPVATVVSGTTDDLERLKAKLVAQDAVRTKELTVSFAFHSFQMDPILQDYKAIASGVTYLPPRIPVASTLLASLVSEPGVFSEDYLTEQTRQAVDFNGALNATKSVLKDPVWLEIGPGPVCTSFVRATLSPPPANIIYTIDANSSNWVSISKSLVAAYMRGVNVDWLALHAPYENNLRLLPLPTYAWDVKDYWITYTDNENALTPTKIQDFAPTEPYHGTTAQYLVEKILSPSVQVTFRAGISDHGFIGLIDGHKMQQIGLASGSVFSDAAATVAKYALEYSGRKDVTVTNLTFHDPELLAPLTRHLVGVDGELYSTAFMESTSAEIVLVKFKATSKRGESYDLGSMKVKYRNPEKALIELDRVSFFIRFKMEDRIRLSKDGTGHRIQPDVFFTLFANAVEFSPDFQGVQEAFVDSDFHEAAATIMLPPHPVGTSFTSSPYWSEALLHLAGFMVNGNPRKSTQSTFVVMGYDTFEQLAIVEPGKQYLTYTRISRWENDTAFCAGYVFDPETSRIVMQAVDLRYQKFKTATWRHILDGPHDAKPQYRAAVPRAIDSTTGQTKIPDQLSAALAAVPVERPESKLEGDDETSDSTGFKIVVDCIAKASGNDPLEFTDDTMMSDIGVDSIMAIEVVAAAKDLGVDLPATFVFEHPTIHDLRCAFGGTDARVSDYNTGATPPKENEDIPSPSPGKGSAPSSTPKSLSSLGSSMVRIEEEPEVLSQQTDNDTSPHPSVRITLLQGRPGTTTTPLYMVADGTGTVTSYIHLRPFKSKVAIYGIDSPYFRCPSRMTSQVGIEGVAKLIVEALLEARPTGSFLLGGYSAGCLVAYEVSRQLAVAGRTVDGLLVVDMCCPRSRRTDQRTLLAEDEFSYDVFEAAVNKDCLWSSLSSSRDHFRAFFVAMNEYTPAPLERPVKTVVIWAERGLVNRVSDDTALMKRLTGQGVPIRPYPGFMEDPKLGTFACLVPDKGKNLGPNGWDKYTGGEVMALSVAGDHFELLMPRHVHLLQEQMEKAFTYFSLK